MIISICLICKNEEENIEKCLVSLKNTGLELIVVDTGSTDQTKEIAENIPTIYMISPGAMILPPQKIMPSPQPPTTWLWS